MFVLGGRIAPPLLKLFKDEDSRWPEEVTRAINELPLFSTVSTTDGPNSSAITGSKGMLLADVGSSVTPLWVCTSDGTGNWSALSWI